MTREAFVVTVEPQLKRQFKAAVAEQGTTMTAATEALLRLYVSGDAKKLIEEHQSTLEEEVTPA